ncbi:MAG: hypothetical protein HQ579_07890 [Candidatus Omnitrophica bacterium]|nr:hypothetical protein [Candidatus Omnitrophota bacterium]
MPVIVYLKCYSESSVTLYRDKGGRDECESMVINAVALVSAAEFAIYCKTK